MPATVRRTLEQAAVARQSCITRVWRSPAQMPLRARSSVMDSFANMPFMPPMGHRWRHHSRRSKTNEHAIAPAWKNHACIWATFIKEPYSTSMWMA